MMGVKDFQGKLLYGFTLEEKVPADHLLRIITSTVDFGFIRRLARPFYSHTGAPSVDPVVVFKMSLIGYLYGIASERRLAEECRLNMAFLWFLGYDIDETPPDHSILSKARARFGRKVYEEFFAEIVRQCKEKGLIEGDSLFLDSTLLKANASLDSMVSRTLYSTLRKPEEYLDEVWGANPGSDSDDYDGGDNDGGNGGQPKNASRKITANELRVSKTDPDATMVRRKDTKLFLGHKVHIGVDGGEARIVTSVIASSGTVRESQVAPPLLEKHVENTGVRPEEVVGDKGYSSREFYRHLRDLGIRPSIPKAHPWKNVRKRRLDAGFRYDPDRGTYVCPAGKQMYRMKYDKSRVVYLMSRYACQHCRHHGRLCKARRPSFIEPVDQNLHQWLEAYLNSRRAKISVRDRKIWPETVFAEMKNARGLDRARLRGRDNVWIEALMALAAHNVRQMATTLHRRSGAQALRLTAVLSRVFSTVLKAAFNPT